MSQNVKDQKSTLKAMKPRTEERELVIYDNEGQHIYGVLHKPIGVQKAPAVLMCHGFAGNKIGRYRIYVNLAQKLAEAGIASLRIDFRGCGESEGDFSDVTVETEVSDACKGLEFLRNHPAVESSSIGILGNSFGGAIAVRAAFQDQNIRSLVLLAPLFNSAQWRQKWEAVMSNSADESCHKEMARILDGNAPGPAFYPSFFKLNLDKEMDGLKKTPILHIHSDRDDRVGQDQAEHYRRCRQDASAATHWIRLQKSDHDFSSSEERKMLIDETVQWFVKTLQ